MRAQPRGHRCGTNLELNLLPKATFSIRFLIGPLIASLNYAGPVQWQHAWGTEIYKVPKSDANGKVKKAKQSRTQLSENERGSAADSGKSKHARQNSMKGIVEMGTGDK
ncbi:unnamed protein product [Rodentolepis nana]|uniref:Uncharacterized protein n=1 Tax=Rodentolepis nana TaxID=102285 RepID=A0A0R3TA01_RODNA|nr:unnamed protein product [Rodentolepis nana]